MKIKTDTLPATLRDLYSSDGFARFTESKLGNDLFINDPDRADRIHTAAEDGCEGSTHAEVMEDWTEYAEQLRDDALRAAWNEDDSDTAEAAVESWFERISSEIESCEKWHADNGTLHEQIG